MLTKDTPVWETVEEQQTPNPAPCCERRYTWIAFFFEGGRLAYWECAECGARNREITQLPERLDIISGWIKSPPRLVARGSHPPVSIRRWATPRGAILSDGDPSSIHFVGAAIPRLVEAHTYEVPHAGEPKRKVILSGLQLLADEKPDVR